MEEGIGWLISIIKSVKNNKKIKISLCVWVSTLTFPSLEDIPGSIFVRSKICSFLKNQNSLNILWKEFFMEIVFLKKEPLNVLSHYLVRYGESLQISTLARLCCCVFLSFICTTRPVIWHYSTVVGDKCQHAIICMTVILHMFPSRLWTQRG